MSERMGGREGGQNGDHTSVRAFARQASKVRDNFRTDVPSATQDNKHLKSRQRRTTTPTHQTIGSWPYVHFLERGELPNEEGDVVREYKAMHEENFWSSWPREDERGKGERTAKAEKKEEEKGEKRKSEEEKENETGTVKRRCEGLVSVEAFDIFSQGRDVESVGDLSWEDPLQKLDELSECGPVSCALVRVVPDATTKSHM